MKHYSKIIKIISYFLVPYIKNISINNKFKTEVNLTISLTTENERLCPPRDLLVNCTSTDPWSWVIKETTDDLQLVSLTHDFLLGNLSEFTNYTCNFEILGGNSTNLHFQTAEDGKCSQMMILNTLFLNKWLSKKNNTLDFPAF